MKNLRCHAIKYTMLLKHRCAPYFLILVLMASVSLLMFFLSAQSRISSETCEKLGLKVMYIDTLAGKKIANKTDYISSRYELGEFSGGCKIRGRGNTTWVTRELFKRPYLVKLDEARPLLGQMAAQKWVLMANTADKTSLRNSYARFLATQVWNRMRWTPDASFVALFLNGKFNGLYELTEKIEYASISLPEDSFLAVVNDRLNKEYNFTTTNGTKISIRMKDKTTGEYDRMRHTVQAAEDALFAEDFAKDSGWRRFLDEDSFVDWYLVNEFTKNHDARFQASCWFYFDSSSQKIFMGPIWDFDLSCGNIRWHTCDDPEGFFVNSEQWYKRLFEDETFFVKVRQRYAQTRQQLSLSLEWLQSEADRIKPLVELNDTVWHNIGHRQWPHAPGWKDRKTYESEVAYMMDFLKKRKAWFDEVFS